MPPRLRVLAQNARHEKRMQSEISSSLSSVLKTNPKMDLKEAMWTVTNEMLTNNPYQPPKDGKCPINDLPDEILGYIFSVGVQQELEDEISGYTSEDDEDWEDADAEEEDEDEDEEEDEGEDGSPAVPAAAVTGTVGEDSDSDSNGTFDSDMFDDDVKVPFQVLVSHVCKRWRAVALDSHVLWTTLDFAKRPNLEKARTYISRAQGLPLSICIDCTFPEDVDEEDHPDHPLYSENRKARKAMRHVHHCGDPDCENVDEDMDVDEDAEDEEDEVRFLSQQELASILDLIEPEVAHWGSLEFHASTYGYVHMLLSRLHNLPAAPLLETFQVYHFEDCDDYEFFSGDDKTCFLPFHGNAPLLKDACFWGVHIDWDGAVPNFLRGLRDLELSFHAKDVRPSYATFAQIINNSPELHTLSLSLSGPALPAGVEFDAAQEDGGWGPEPLTIPSLHELALQFHDVKYACALAQHLDVPSVTGLLLNFDEEDYTALVRALLRPVRGRAASLLQHIDHLKIAGLPCDVASADLFLDQLANLRSLNIKLVGREEDVLFEKLIDPARTKPAAENVWLGPGVDVDAAAAGGSGSGASGSGSGSGGQAQSQAGFALPRVFCPKLETLTTNAADGHRVQALVAARRAAGAALSRVFMSHNDRVSAKEEKWLRAHLDALEFFEPSDSEEDVVFGEEELEEEDGWETESGDGEDGDEDDDDEDGGEPPLISPLARHLGRGARRRGRMDLD